MRAASQHRPGQGGGQTGYKPQLDALRFIAVLGVLIAHFWRYNFLPGVLTYFDWANSGVRLFFVLSGFLITGILLRSRQLAEEEQASPWFYIRQFYARRFLRIFPIYYLVLAVVLLVGLPPSREIWPWLVTYTTNLYIAAHQTWIGRIGHFWTLAVEEQFYLIWPWLVIFLPRRWQVPFLVSLVLVAPAYRFYLATVHWQDVSRELTTGTHTLACLDSLGLGALLAVIFQRISNPAPLKIILDRVLLPAALTGFLGVYVYFVLTQRVRLYYTLDNLLQSLIFVWLVARTSWGFGGITGRLFEYRPLVHLGKITYGIYVYHNFVPVLVGPLLAWMGLVVPERSFLAFVLYSVISVAVAQVSWVLIEQPINRYKRYFEYDRPLAAADPLPLEAK